MAKKIILLLALILLTMTPKVDAAENDLPFNFLATTYVEGGSHEVLALVKMKNSGALAFMVSAKDVKNIAMIPYSYDFYNFYMRKDQYDDCPPLIFTMLVTGQERGQSDDNLGEWKDDLHFIPVYALCNVKDGQVICSKPFYSTTSMESTHYHDTVKNPDNTRLIEIFMTHMPRLHEAVQAKGINLS